MITAVASANTAGPNASSRPVDGFEDIERPPLAPHQWRRPYRIGGFRVGGATLLLALCPMLLLGALLSFVAGGTVRAIVAFVVAALLVALALRILRAGTYVSSRGLRRVALFRTRTVTWQQVAETVTRQEPVRVLGTPRRVNGQSVLVRQVGGDPIEEAISSHNADFLSKSRAEDFEAAVEAINEWYRRHAPAARIPANRRAA